MIIIVDHLKDAPLTFHIDESVETFPLLAGMAVDKHCVFTGKLQGDITVTREFDNIRVNGRVAVPLALSCSRCLEDFASFIDTSFTIFFRKDKAIVDSSDDELELGELDLISSTYSGNEIDLTHELEEQVAMEIPLKPLCKDTCKGLCHVCGTDLNISSCSCGKESLNLQFSALKDFKISNK